MIRNIVFDMGKVLLDYNPLLPCLRHAGNEADAIALKKAIFDDPGWGELIDGGVMTDQEYLPEAQKRLETDRLKALAAEVMEDWWLDALFPKLHMEEVLGELLEKGYRLYVLSNCGFTFRKFCYKIPHINRFAGVLVSAEQRMLKPNAEIYRRLFEMFSLKPEECLFVDDLEENIAGAEAEGMRGYCFADGDVQRLRERLASL